MFDDDMPDGANAGGAGGWPLIAPNGEDPGWRAGDFKNGLGLLGMVPPAGHYLADPVDRLSPAAFSPLLPIDGDSTWAAVDRLASNDSANPQKESCLEICSHIALPTADYGVQFQRCLHQCMGTNSYPEWEGRF